MASCMLSLQFRLITVQHVIFAIVQAYSFASAVGTYNLNLLQAIGLNLYFRLLQIMYLAICQFIKMLWRI